MKVGRIRIPPDTRVDFCTNGKSQPYRLFFESYHNYSRVSFTKGPLEEYWTYAVDVKTSLGETGLTHVRLYDAGYYHDVFDGMRADSDMVLRHVRTVGIRVGRWRFVT